MARAFALVFTCCSFIALAACGSTSSGSSKPLVVATTTQLADFTRAVGGSAIAVHQILKPNTDPHEYEPRPSDISASANAKVVFESGDNLDLWMSKVIDQAGGKPTVVDLGKSATSHLPGETSGPEASKYDPHWWHDPQNAIAAVQKIRSTLVAADPAHKGEFNRNAGAYVAKLRALDAGIQKCFAPVPPAQRKLVTSHDAFNYFAHRYDVTVVGAIIPSQTTEAQPSAGDVARLANQIRREHVKAVFLESSVNPKLARAVAKETGVIGNLSLYGDTLGPAGSPGATYLGMEQANADAMARGFTGGTQGCKIPGL
jgi:zinc/manganese transport system substrate-binding protein